MPVDELQLFFFCEVDRFAVKVWGLYRKRAVNGFQVFWYHNAVPFTGMKNVRISVFSSVNSFTFLSIPPAYPVRLPFVPTTLWQGTIMEISLCPTAPPTAWADMWESPFSAAIPVPAKRSGKPQPPNPSGKHCPRAYAAIPVLH